MTVRRVALVTGGAHGIGEATAVELADAGCEVHIVDIDEANGQKVCRSIVAEGHRACFHLGDLFTASGPGTAVASVLATTDGRLDVLVNNAFSYKRGRMLADMAAEELTADLARLVVSYQTMIREARSALAAAEGGAVVNLSSVRGVFTAIGHGSYSVAKAAVTQLTRVLADELGRDGIRVNGVAPGVIATRRLMARGPGRRELAAGITPLGRIGRPEDVAKVIRFLASDDSGFITGQTVTVDGGLTLPLQIDASAVGITRSERDAGVREGDHTVDLT